MEFLDIVEVSLHSILEVLLGLTNVGFASDSTFDFIHNNSVSAYSIIVALAFVSCTVASPVCEV